jgi:hypothetical protein
MIDNVIAFKRPEPALSHVEVRLNTEDCSLVLTVIDEAGNHFGLDYVLQWATPGFDLDRLRRDWERWKGQAGLAS